MAAQLPMNQILVPIELYYEVMRIREALHWKEVGSPIVHNGHVYHVFTKDSAIT